MCGEEWTIDGLGDCDVAGVIGGEVVPELPDATKQRVAGKHPDREGEEIVHRMVGLLGRQLSDVCVPPEDRRDLDAQEIGPDDVLTLQPLPESPSIIPAVGDDRSEDRRINDEHVPL